MNLTDKKVLITGGLGGFGAALAESLSNDGAEIIIFDIKDEKRKNYFMVDISDEKSVKEALSDIDRIDILINCAGEIYSEPLINLIKKTTHERSSWDRIVNNNLTACFNINLQTAYKMISKRVPGVIINFSSISAQGNSGQAAYAAAKAGVEALTKVLAKELGMFKIRAVSIAPGFIDTPSTHMSLNKGMLDYWIKQTPLRQLGQLEDIIKTVKYAIDCDHLSGCTIEVNGALSV